MIASLSSPPDFNLFPPQMEIEGRLAVEEDDGGIGGRFSSDLPWQFVSESKQHSL